MFLSYIAVKRPQSDAVEIRCVHKNISIQNGSSCGKWISQRNTNRKHSLYVKTLDVLKGHTMETSVLVFWVIRSRGMH